MKNILLLVILLVPVFAIGQNRALNDFYRKHHHTYEVQNFRVPGWLIRFGGSIARMAAETPEEREAFELLRGFGPVRVMIAEQGSQIPQNEIEKLRKDLLRDNFEDLLMVREGKENVNLMIREEGNWIKNLFFIVNEADGGEMMFFSAETNIHYDELQSVINTLLKEEMKTHLHIEPVKSTNKKTL